MHRIRFLKEGGGTRPADAGDAAYLQAADRMVRDAARATEFFTEDELEAHARGIHMATSEAKPPKPLCRLSREDGNVFAVLGRASRALRDAGQYDRAKEMQGRVMAAKSYDQALQIVLEYVDDGDPSAARDD